jgi:RNA polymerase sigma-70 factor (ECF subfamily)
MNTSSQPRRPIQFPADVEEVRRHLMTAMRRVCPTFIADEAEDLVQRAMIKLMTSEGKIEENPAYSASYLWRVAYTAVIDEIRRRDRRREVPLIEDSANTIPASSQPDPEREATSRGIGDAIRDCLRNMVDARRRAVTLHLVGHTGPEIARLLDQRSKQTDNLVYRGMADLRRCLSGKGVTP